MKRLSTVILVLVLFISFGNLFLPMDLTAGEVFTPKVADRQFGPGSGWMH